MHCKLLSGEGSSMTKHIFGHVTFLIGWNVHTPNSGKFPRASVYMCQIWKKCALYHVNYCKNKMQIWQSRLYHIQTSVNRGTLNDTVYIDNPDFLAHLFSSDRPVWTSVNKSLLVYYILRICHDTALRDNGKVWTHSFLLAGVC